MKRPDDTVALVKPWRDYADELEQQLSTLRRLAKDKLDTENDCWASGTDSVLFAAQTRNVKAYEALKAALEAGDE